MLPILLILRVCTAKEDERYGVSNVKAVSIKALPIYIKLVKINNIPENIVITGKVLSSIRFDFVKILPSSNISIIRSRLL